MSEQTPDAPERRSGRREVTWVALEPSRLRRTLLVIAVALLAVQAISWSLASMAGFLFNLLVAWLIAIAIDPVVASLARRGWKRGAAAGLVLGSSVAVLVLFAVLLGQALADQLDELIAAVPALGRDTATWVNGTFGARIDADSLQATLSVEKVADSVASSAGGFMSVLGGVLGGVLTVVTIGVFAFYFSADTPRIQRFIASWLRPDRQVVFIQIWDISVAKAGAFVISKVALAVISAACHAGFFFVIDLPYWLPMGLFAGVVSQFVPVVGTYVGIVVPAVFASTHGAWSIVLVVGFATVYQQIENYILTPRLSRATMDLHPGVALGAVFAATALVGPVGALIGIPLAAISVAVVEEFGKRYDLHPQVHAAISASEPDVGRVLPPDPPVDPPADPPVGPPADPAS